MKNIRLEIPLDIWENVIDNRIWMKVSQKSTEIYQDRECTTPILPKGRMVGVEVNVPEELNLIEVVGLGGLTPIQDISTGWILESTDPNWRFPELKKVLVLMKNLTHEVPVIDEKPDRDEWEKYCEKAEGGWLFLKNWAMEVYIFEKETIASFHWHPNLEKEYASEIREI